MSTIAEIEDLIIAQLVQEISWLKTCKSYDGELEKDPKQLAMRTPAVLVAMTSCKSSPSEFNVVEHVYKFVLIIVARNLRGESGARRESGGAYDIIDAIRVALMNRILTEDIHPATLLKEEAQEIATGYVIYTATYEIISEEEIS